MIRIVKYSERRPEREHRAYDFTRGSTLGTLFRELGHVSQRQKLDLDWNGQLLFYHNKIVEMIYDQEAGIIAELDQIAQKAMEEEGIDLISNWNIELDRCPAYIVQQIVEHVINGDGLDYVPKMGVKKDAVLPQS